MKNSTQKELYYTVATCLKLTAKSRSAACFAHK